MTERVRLADLARQAGVSTATVSRVLNGKETVAPATRQAVLTALDLLGYERPERLRQRPGGLIGLIVPELSNPIFPSFAQNLETTMAARGYTPLLCTQTAGGITEDAYVQLLLDQLHAAVRLRIQHRQQGLAQPREIPLGDAGLVAVPVLARGYAKFDVKGAD